MLANTFCDFKSCLLFLDVALILNSNVQLVGSYTVCGALTMTYFQYEDDTGFELCFSPAIELTSYKWVHFSLEVTPDFAFSNVYANVPTVVIKPVLESDEGYYIIDCLDALGRQFFSNSVVVQKPYVLPTTMDTRTININVTSAPPNLSNDTADAGNCSVTGANSVTTADDKFEITVTSATTTEEEVPEVIDSSTIEALTMTYFQYEDDTGFELCFSPAIELTSYKWVHFSLEVTPDFAFSKVYANVPTVVIKPVLESDEGYYIIDCLDALGRQFFSNSVVVQKPYALPTTMDTRTININVTSVPPNVSNDTADAGNYSVTGANSVTTADDKFEITVTSATTTEEEVPEVIDSSTIEVLVSDSTTKQTTSHKPIRRSNPTINWAEVGYIVGGVILIICLFIVNVAVYCHSKRKSPVVGANRRTASRQSCSVVTLVKEQNAGVGANRRTDRHQSCSFVTLVKKQNAGDNTYNCTVDGVDIRSAHKTLQSFASVKPKTRKRYENVFLIHDEADAREDGEQEAKIENEYRHLSIDVTEAAYNCTPDTYGEVPGETTNHPPIMNRSNVESCLNDAANEDRKGIPANYSEVEPGIELYESLQGRPVKNEYAGTTRVYENVFLYKDN